MNPDIVSAQVPDIADGVSELTKASTTEVQTITSRKRKKTNAQKCREYRERKKLQNTMVQNITAERSDECSETGQLPAKKPKTDAERRKKYYEAQKLKKQKVKKIPKTAKQRNKECYDRKKKFRALNTLNHHSDVFPSDPLVAALWVEKLRLNRRESHWTPSKYTKICSKHFDDSDRYTTKGGLCKLREGAVPTRGLHIDCCDPDSVKLENRNYEEMPPVESFVECELQSGRARIAKLYHFLKEEYAFIAAHNDDKCDILPLRNIRQRTADATGVSVGTVARILREEKNLPSGSSQFTSPKKKRPKKQIKIELVFNERGKSRSTGTTEDQPSTSAAAEQEYQPTRYKVVSREKQDNEDVLEEIIIKEEISDEDRNQCRLCLSVGRRMQELGDYAPLYRKLLFENNYQNTTIPSFMFQMLACWECIAELRRVRRFQNKVRRANAAFENNQNHKSENMSNLSTIVIGHNDSSAGDVTDRVSRLEVCVQDIKEEAIEAEVEETSVPDPLEVGLGVQKTEEVEQIEKEPDITQKMAKRAKTEPKTSKNTAKRARTEQNAPKTTQEEESNPKSSAETDSVAIFAKVKIEIDELENILAERRNKESFKAMKFKCNSCILGFTDCNRLMEHNKNFHDEDAGSCECDICERRFDDEGLMQVHFRNHFVKFVCKLCQFECYTKTGRTIHYKRHAAALQGASLESLLEQRLTSKQRAGTSGSS